VGVGVWEFGVYVSVVLLPIAVACWHWHEGTLPLPMHEGTLPMHVFVYLIYIIYACVFFSDIDFFMMMWFPPRAMDSFNSTSIGTDQTNIFKL